MSRILIVEDEPYERLELKGEICALYGQDKVKVAESVEEAIEVVNTWKPALILLDIRLKAKSGLEVARYVRNRYPTIEIIIVTAYNEFEYAKEAMSLGINYYLSKPVRSKTLLETIREALHKNKAGAGSWAQPIWPLLETGQDTKAGAYIGFEVNAVLAAGFEKVGEELGEYLNYIDSSLQHGRTKTELKEERVIVYLERSIKDLTTELNSFGRDFEDRFAHGIILGIGHSGSTVTECYLRALAACNHKIFFPSHRVLEYDQTVGEGKNKYDYPLTMEQKLINLVRRGDTAQINEFLHQLAPALVSLSDRNYSVLRTWVEGLYNSLEKLCISEGVLLNGVSALKPDSFWFSAEHLERNLKDLVNGIRAQLEGRVRSQHPLIAQAVDYILEHYQKEITLLEVAQELKISSGYLSRLFKEEIGIPFKNYLIDLRMEKAKELLQQSGLGVFEVAFQVGYSDPNYFSEAFRKYEGMSPSEYREANAIP